MKRWTETGGHHHTLRLHGFRIVIHHHIDYPADVWLMSVHGDVELPKERLHHRDLDEAKAEAVKMLEQRLRACLHELKAVQ